MAGAGRIAEKMGLQWREPRKLRASDYCTAYVQPRGPTQDETYRCQRHDPSPIQLLKAASLHWHVVIFIAVNIRPSMELAPPS